MRRQVSGDEAKRVAVSTESLLDPQGTIWREAEEEVVELLPTPVPLQTSEYIQAVWPERRLTVCRELTKLHEEVFRGTAGEAIEHFARPRDEFAIAIEGRGEPPPDASDRDIADALDRLRAEGLRGRRLVEAGVAATGASRSRVYRVSLGSAEDAEK